MSPRTGALRRRARREVERRLERLHAAAQPIGQDAVDLRERALGRIGGPDRPSRPAACTPSATATASSSVSMSGGSRYPGRIR